MMFYSKFQSHSFKIEDFKINPIGTKEEWVKIKNLLLRISYNMPKMLSSKFWSPSIKTEDLKIKPNNPITLLAPREEMKF